MKLIHYTCIALFGAFPAVSAFAATAAGDDSARHYRSHPDQFDGRKVDVDCAYVTRINGGPQIEGVVLFVAHTVDDKNRTAGGSIVVAVPSDKDETFMRRFGTALDYDRNEARKVDTERLRGVFHQLGTGRVYIDWTGDLHQVIVKNIEAMRQAIPLESPDGEPGPRQRPKRPAQR